MGITGQFNRRRNEFPKDNDMTKRCLRIFLLALAVSQATLPLSSLAQQVRSDGKRKIVTQIRPVYPPLARKLNIRGIVHLRVTVSPAGKPIRTEEIGGNPLLVKACSDAVSKAKWEPASSETKEVIEISFQTVSE